MRQDAGRHSVARLLAAMLLALAAATALAESARLGWLPELAAHFRPQYVLALVVLAAAALALGRRALAVGALLVLAPNLWSAGPYLLPWVMPGPAASPSVSGPLLLSLNLLYRNTDHQDVRAYLERVQPDVLVLAELTPDWLRALEPALATYPYQLAVNQRGPWGLGVFSRFPLRNPQGTDLGLPGSFNVITMVDFPGGPVQLTAVHLASPTSPQHAARRNLQLDRLAGLLRAQPPALPRLLVGDLNVTPFSPYMHDLLERTGMQDARRERGGLLGTWPSWMPLLQVAIDHCIVDPGLAVASVERGPALGSDHYPLVIRLGPRSQQANPP